MLYFSVEKELEKLRIPFYAYPPEYGPYDLTSLSRENIEIFQSLVDELLDKDKIISDGLRNLAPPQSALRVRDIKVIRSAPLAALKKTNKMLMEKIRNFKDYEDKSFLWERCFRVASWFKDKIFWTQLRQYSSEETSSRWELEWQPHAIYAHCPASALWRLTFVLRHIDKLAEEAIKEAEAKNTLTSRVFNNVSSAFSKLFGKPVENKRILKKRKIFIADYLEHLKNVRKDVAHYKQCLAASMYARLLLAHERKSLTDGNIVASFLGQILQTVEIPLIELKGRTHRCILLKDRVFDFTQGLQRVLSQDSPCAEPLKRKCFNKFLLHILEEEEKKEKKTFDLSLLCAPLNPNDSQTGICIRFGLTAANKNALLKGPTQIRRKNFVLAVPDTGKASLLSDAKNRTCYLGPPLYSLVKYNLAMGRLFTYMNQEKNARPSLAFEFKECSKFVMEVLEDISVIESQPDFAFDIWAKRVHDAWKDVIHEQMYHLFVYCSHLMSEYSEELKKNKSTFDSESSNLFSAVSHFIYSARPSQPRVQEEQRRIGHLFQDFNGDLTSWLFSLLAQPDASEQKIEVCISFLKASQKLGYPKRLETSANPMEKHSSKEKEMSKEEVPLVPIKKGAFPVEEPMDQLLEYLLGIKHPKTEGDLDQALQGVPFEKFHSKDFLMHCIGLISRNSSHAVLPFLESCDEAFNSNFAENWKATRAATFAQLSMLLISAFKIQACPPEKILECQNAVKKIQEAYPQEESEKKLKEITSLFLSDYLGTDATFHSVMMLIKSESIEVAYFSKRLEFLLQSGSYPSETELSRLQNLCRTSETAHEAFDAIVSRYLFDFDHYLYRTLTEKQREMFHAFLLPKTKERLDEALDGFSFRMIHAWLHHEELKKKDYKKMMGLLYEKNSLIEQMSVEEKSTFIKKKTPDSEFYQYFWFLDKFLRGEKINVADFQRMADYLHQIHPHFPAVPASKQQLSKLMNDLCQQEWSRGTAHLVTKLFPPTYTQRYTALQFFWVLKDASFANLHGDFVLSLKNQGLDETKLFERFGYYTFEVIEKTLQWINMPTQNESAFTLAGMIASLPIDMQKAYAQFHQNHPPDEAISEEKQAEMLSKSLLNMQDIQTRYSELKKLSEAKKSIARALQKNNFSEVYLIISTGLREILEADNKSIKRKGRYLQLFVIAPIEVYLKEQIFKSTEEVAFKRIDLNLQIAVRKACRKEGGESAALEKEIADLRKQREALEKGKSQCAVVTAFREGVLKEIAREPSQEDLFCPWDKKDKERDVKRTLLANLQFIADHVERIMEQHTQLMNHLKYYPRDWFVNFDEVGFKSVWIGFSLEKQIQVRHALMSIPINPNDSIENQANQLILNLFKLSLEERETEKCENLLREFNRLLTQNTIRKRADQHFQSWEIGVYKLLESYQPGKYSVVSQRFQRAQLAPEIERELYDKDGMLVDPDLSELPLGQRHYVKELAIPKNDRYPFSLETLGGKCPPLINDTVFYKLKPEMPGDELTVRLLHRYCFDSEMPQAEVFRIPSTIKAPYSIAYPALISETIPGVSLHSLFNKRNGPIHLEKAAFDRKFLMTLLTRPSDEKPENFIAQRVPGEDRLFYVLICPDNEQSFLPSFYIEKVEESVSSMGAPNLREKVRLGIKTILYCFDEMQIPMTEKVIDEVLQKLGESHVDPKTQKVVFGKCSDEKILDILRNWTLALSKINERLSEMFNEEERRHFATLEPPIELLPQIEETLVPTLHATLSKIYLFIKEKQDNQLPVIPIELLSYIYPELAAHYRGPLNDKSLNPLERFALCTDKEYDLLQLEEGEKQCHFGTSTNARAVTQARFTNLEDLNRWKESPKLSAEHALTHAITVCRQNKKLEAIKQELIEGDKGNFVSLAEDLSRESVILSISFKDLPDHNEKGMERKEIEVFILQAMVGTSFQVLDFSHCQELTRDRLFAILKKSPNLKRLNLSHCPQLELYTPPRFLRSEYSYLKDLANYCPYLEGLNLSGIPNLEKIECDQFKELRVLNVSLCEQLTTVLIKTPFLTHFWANGASKLQSIGLTSSYLQRLDIEGCDSLSYLAIAETIPLSPPLSSMTQEHSLAMHIDSHYVCHLTKLTLSEGSHFHYAFYHHFPFLLGLPLGKFEHTFVEALGHFLNKNLVIRSLNATQREQLAGILRTILNEYQQRGERLFKFKNDERALFKMLASNALSLARMEGWKYRELPGEREKEVPEIRKEDLSYNSQTHENEKNKEETRPSLIHSLKDVLNGLEDEDVFKRKEAVEKFITLFLTKKIQPTPEAIQKLSQGLSDPNILVRKAAFQAMSYLVQFSEKSHQAHFHLLTGLEYESKQEKRSLLERLGGQEGAKEFGIWMKAVQEQNPILEESLWELIFAMLIQWPIERLQLFDQLQSLSNPVKKGGDQKGFWKTMKEIFSQTTITPLQTSVLTQAFSGESRLLKIVAWKAACHFIEKGSLDIHSEFSKYLSFFWKDEEDEFIKGLAYEAFNLGLKHGLRCHYSYDDVALITEALGSQNECFRKQGKVHLRLALETGWEPAPDMASQLIQGGMSSWAESEASLESDLDLKHAYALLLRCNSYRLLFDLIREKSISEIWERAIIENGIIEALKKGCKCSLTTLLTGENGSWFSEIVKQTIRDGWIPSQEEIEEIVTHCVNNGESRTHFENILAEIWFIGSLPDTIPRRLLQVCTLETTRQKVLFVYSTLLTVLKRGCYVPPELKEQLENSLLESDLEISRAAFEALTQLLRRQHLFAILKLQFETLHNQEKGEAENEGFEIIPRFSPTGVRKFKKIKKKLTQRLFQKRENGTKESSQSVQAFEFSRFYEFLHLGSWYEPSGFSNERGEKCFPKKTLGSGACALHAVFGRKQNGMYCWQGSDSEARQAFAIELKSSLFKREKRVEESYQEFITSLAESKSTELAPNKQLLARSAEIQALIDHHRLTIEGIEKEISELNLVRIEKLIAMSIESQKQGVQYREKLYAVLKIDSNVEFSLLQWKKICRERLGALTRFYKEHPKIAQSASEFQGWRESRAQLVALKNKMRDTRKKLCRNEKLREAYLKAILDTNYWFTTDEIKIMAFLHNFSVEIYSTYNSEIYKADGFNIDATNRRIIFQTHSPDGRGYHFWRCTLNQ